MEHLQRVIATESRTTLWLLSNWAWHMPDAGDFDHAIQTSETSSGIGRHVIFGRLQSGNRLCAEADDDRSDAAAFRHSLSISPDYAAGHRGLGEVLLYQGQVDDALTELRRAAELAPMDPANHAALAKALSAKGLNAEAQRRNAEGAAGTPLARSDVAFVTRISLETHSLNLWRCRGSASVCSGGNSFAPVAVQRPPM